VPAVDEFMRSMAANGSPVTTLHSYACSLLRWWRFLAAIDVAWDRAGRVEVRDFVLWLRFGDGRPGGYAPATINHSLAVLRSFYEERATVGQGPVMNPVPAAAGRDGQRPHAHHDPMEPFHRSQRAPLRQKNPTVGTRGLSDAAFNDLFAAMASDRDRALLAFYVSTGARAVELLGLTLDRVDVGGQVIGVHRKGTGRLQWLPASPDAFVWWRLYEGRLDRPAGETAVWLTRRAPVVALSYAAMRRVLQRANDRLDTGWTLHDLRHTAARRLIADPAISLTDVQWVLGHAHLSTTAVYLRPDDDEMIGKAAPTTRPARPGRYWCRRPGIGLRFSRRCWARRAGGADAGAGVGTGLGTDRRLQRPDPRSRPAVPWSTASADPGADRSARARLSGLHSAESTDRTADRLGRDRGADRAGLAAARGTPGWRRPDRGEATQRADGRHGGAVGLADPLRRRQLAATLARLRPR
jgi:site-specific recombinase XerD